jgi:hypothetical protein
MVMALYTAIMAVVGLGLIGLVGSDPASFRNWGASVFSFYVVAAFLSTWVTNGLQTVRVKR